MEGMRKKLQAIKSSDRLLDGDIWWTFLSADMRSSFDRTGYVQQVIEREGSAGKGLASFFDSTRRPPSLLDHAPNLTGSTDETRAFIHRHLPGYRIAFECRTDGTCLGWVTRTDDEPSIPSIAKTCQAALLLAFFDALDLNESAVGPFERQTP